MKTIHYINVTIYFLFIIIIIFNGIAISTVSYDSFEVFILLGLIILGVTQPILALILLLYIPELNKMNRRLLYCYWLVVLLFFTLALIASTKTISEQFIKYIGPVLLLIAPTLFVFTTYKIQKQ